MLFDVYLQPDISSDRSTLPPSWLFWPRPWRIQSYAWTLANWPIVCTAYRPWALKPKVPKFFAWWMFWQRSQVISRLRRTSQLKRWVTCSTACKTSPVTFQKFVDCWTPWRLCWRIGQRHRKVWHRKGLERCFLACRAWAANPWSWRACCRFWSPWSKLAPWMDRPLEMACMAFKAWRVTTQKCGLCCKSYLRKSLLLRESWLSRRLWLWLL